MHGHGHVTNIQDPGGVGLPKPLFMGSILLIIIGVIAMIDRLLGTDTHLQGWLALLHAYFFFFMLSLGGTVFTAIQYCASARWSIAVRRIAEGFAIFLPISFVLFLIIAILGFDALYNLKSEYRLALPKGTIYLEKNPNDLISKVTFLTQEAVIIKGVVFYAIWGAFSFFIRKNSISQKDSNDVSFYKKNVKLSIFFLILFMYTFSIHAIDMLMALEPKWFSTMFGVYMFAGMFLSTMCLIAVIVIMLRKHRAVSEAITKRHLYDLGTWIMAFSCFMCYVGFSQFMLIWYANIPEETFYLIERSSNGWEYIFGSLAIFKWIIPFAFLMPQGFRSSPAVIIPVAVAVFLGQWLDLYWVIYPTFFSAPVTPGIAELGSFFLVLGAFGIALDRVYRKHSVLPMNDPYLATSVNGSYL